MDEDRESIWSVSGALRVWFAALFVAFCLIGIIRHVVVSLYAAEDVGKFAQLVFVFGFKDVGVLGASAAMAAYLVVTAKELFSMAMFSTFEKMKARVRQEGYRKALADLKVRALVNVDYPTNRVTIHDAYCRFSSEYAENKQEGDGEWRGYETLDEARRFAESTGLHVRVCRLCNARSEL